MPLPLPLPPGAPNAPGAPGGANENTAPVAGAVAKITVLANDGAKVTFDGVESTDTGIRHTFTTRPLSTNAPETRVKVQVGGSTISIGLSLAAEKATIDHAEVTRPSPTSPKVVVRYSAP